jgi:hypothetical protein
VHLLAVVLAAACGVQRRGRIGGAAGGRVLFLTAVRFVCYALQVWGSQAYQGKVADIWSLGVTLHAMVFGTLPYFALDQQELIAMVTHPDPWKCAHAEADEDLIDLLAQMMLKQPEDRISLDQARCPSDHTRRLLAFLLRPAFLPPPHPQPSPSVPAATRWHSALRCSPTCPHMHTHTHTHSITHAYTHTNTHTHTHAHTHARTHTHTLTHPRAPTRTHARTLTRTHSHARTHTHTHSRAHTRTHTHAHARTHMHTPAPQIACAQRPPSPAVCLLTRARAPVARATGQVASVGGQGVEHEKAGVYG